MSEPSDTAMPDQIERELLLPAPPEEVWQVVTGSGWLADEVQLDLVPGGEASFRGDGWTKQGWIEEAVAPGGEVAIAPGSDVAIAPGGEGALEPGSEHPSGTLVFWWSADGEPASRVELTIEPAGEGQTRLRVVESRPLEMLDIVGMPLPGAGGSTYGPAMLVAA